MHTARSNFSRPGYTLVEVLVAAGIISAAIGAAASLSMNMAGIDDRTRDKAAALYMAEGVARLWQVGFNPNTVMLRQLQGQAGTVSTSAMSYTLTPAATATSMGTDGTLSQGNMETATVTVTYRPLGSDADSTISLEVLRPAAANHR